MTDKIEEKIDDKVNVNVDDLVEVKIDGNAPVTVATPEHPKSKESSSNSSTAKVCAWVAFLLINFAFIALVSWGAFTTWWIGFVINVVYTILLLAAGLWLLRRNEHSVITSLVLLLAVLSIAVAGLYLPLNVFPCSPDRSSYYNNYNEWVTDTQDLPQDVQDWWSYSSENTDMYSSFAHFNDTGVTIFGGSKGEYDNKLLRVQNGDTPEVMDGIDDPQDFVKTDTLDVCFSFDVIGDADRYADFKVACTQDGLEFLVSEESFESRITRMIYSNNSLWIRQYDNSNSRTYGAMLYSLDVSTLSEVKLYSYDPGTSSDANSSDENKESCTSEQQTRIFFISWLFLSALPALAAALLIDYFHKVPTMPIAAYASLEWLVVCLIFSINPNFGFDDDLFNLTLFFGWWAVLTTGPWLILLTLAHLTNRSTKSRLAWSTNFAALVYVPGMLILCFYNWFGDFSDQFWQWALFTLFTVPPLFLVSIVTGHILVMVLASIVILFDVWRLTSYIAYVSDFDSVLPVHFVVLGLSGLLLGFLGYFLSKRQARINTATSNWAKRKLGRWMIDSEDEELNGNGEHITADSNVETDV